MIKIIKQTINEFSQDGCGGLIFLAMNVVGLAAIIGLLLYRLAVG
jgi:hypothetical protein